MLEIIQFFPRTWRKIYITLPMSGETFSISSPTVARSWFESKYDKLNSIMSEGASSRSAVVTSQYRCWWRSFLSQNIRSCSNSMRYDLLPGTWPNIKHGFDQVHIHQCISQKESDGHQLSTGFVIEDPGNILLNQSLLNEPFNFIAIYLNALVKQSFASQPRISCCIGIDELWSKWIWQSSWETTYLLQTLSPRGVVELVELAL